MRVISSEKLLLAIALPLSGCNLIGAGIGGAIDSNTPGAPLVMPAELDSLVQGTRVRVLKKDLTEIRGTYEALSQVAAHKYPLSEYPHIFEQWMGEKHHETSWIPPLGTGVRVAVRSLHGETIYDGSFGGFDPGVIRIISRPKEEVLGIRLDHVQGVFDSVGRSMVSTDLLIHTVDKGVPFANALTQKPGIILREYPQSGIPIDDILEVNPLGSGNCKIIGGCLGLAVDLLIVLAAYNDFQHHGFLQK